MCALFSAAVHDFKHPGQNNLFQQNTKTKWATRYSDISILENMHISAAFELL